MSVGRAAYGSISVMRATGVENADGLKIGAFTSLADGIKVMLGGEHHIEWVSTFPFRAFAEYGYTPEEAARMATGKGEVVIGSDVWIGGEVFILSGSVIGDGAVVAARSVVSGTVAPYAVVAGNPARFVKWRHTEEQRRALLQIRWWDWPDERIQPAIPYLTSPDVQTFIDKVNRGAL